jgi:hypothetical protein
VYSKDIGGSYAGRSRAATEVMQPAARSLVAPTAASFYQAVTLRQAAAGCVDASKSGRSFRPFQPLDCERRGTRRPVHEHARREP